MTQTPLLLQVTFSGLVTVKADWLWGSPGPSFLFCIEGVSAWQASGEIMNFLEKNRLGETPKVLEFSIKLEISEMKSKPGIVGNAVYIHKVL